LIISPWNYPVNLGIVPLAGAIAAGNCAFIKLSRHSRNVGKLFETLLNKYMDTSCIVAESDGGAAYITALLKEHWDYIFFTGSVSVGRVVYEAAAKFLTPVTLELGGKNPCIIDREANVDLAAKRVVWGKFWNCAQVCGRF
jgi:acyl-CoA reductase-like NAD-dependent aldehyde dehydrogenase